MQPTPFPTFLRLEGRRCLVVGEGSHAEQKVDQLRASGARVDQVTADAFRSRDLEGIFLVVVADQDPEIQEWVAGLACSRRTLLYVMDRAELSDMMCGAILDRGDLKVVVSTSGRFPMLASKIRDRLARHLPEAAADAVRLLGEARDAIRVRHGNDFPAKLEAMKGIVTEDALDAIEDGDLDAVAGIIGGQGRSVSAPPAVRLIGAGPGDPELLTVKALRHLRRADVVFYDALVSEEILRTIPAGVERVPVGRRLGRVIRSQDEINEAMIERARRGERVVRLKGGDPGVFGRVGEETEALEKAGLRVEIVPGVTAALAAAAATGVPLTWRGLAATCVFVSAYGADETEGEENPDRWSELRRLAREVDTLAVYMGATRGGSVARTLLQAGRPAEQGVVVVENASLPSEEVHWTTLGELALARTRFRRPALILIGPTVTAVMEAKQDTAAGAQALAALVQGGASAWR